MQKVQYTTEGVAHTVWTNTIYIYLNQDIKINWRLNVINLCTQLV